jgi:hypothetical protein
VQDPIPAVPPGADIDRRLESIRATLEQLRRTSPAKTADALRPTLDYATQLLETWNAIAPALQPATDPGRWDGCDALAARVAFEIYDRVVRELRLAALDAQTRIEQAEAVLAAARGFARRTRQRAGKMAAKLQRS